MKKEIALKKDELIQARKQALDQAQSNNSFPNLFDNTALQSLSDKDRALFKLYGQGIHVPLPYSCIHHAIEAQVAKHPLAIAIEHQGESMTYQELNHQANKLATILVKQGIRKGDFVGIFLQRSIPMVIGILATLKVGAAYVPQHAGVATSSQLLNIMEVTRMKVVLTLANFNDLIPQKEAVNIISIDEFLLDTIAQDQHFNAEFTPHTPVSQDEVCFTIFTSGTTGPPNGVQVSHKNVCNILLTSPGDLGMRHGLKVGQILSIAFDMAVWEILGALSHGATLVIRGKDINETAQQVDIIIATPSILSTIDANQCKRVQTVAVAGEPCPIPLANIWASFCNFYNSCGPTETTIVNTMQLCEPNAKHITIGKPTPNNTVYVLNEHKQPCAIGEVGQMWGGGHCVSKGYINNDELNKKRYALDPFLNNGEFMFNTGDLGRWNANGELEHYGRIDDQVKIRGFRVELDSVSSVLETTSLCKDAVTLKFDSQHLVAFVSPANVAIDKAMQKIKDKLPYYCLPKFIIPMDTFPMTSRGKVDKRKLMNIAKNKALKANSTTNKNTISQEELDVVKLPKQLPFFKRIWKTEALMHYHRIFTLVALINLCVLGYGIFKGQWWSTEAINLPIISNIVLINFSIGILVRQHYLINLFFKIATSIPHSVSIKIRRFFGKVYHFGGFHSGSNVSGTVWFALLVGSLTYAYHHQISNVSFRLISTTYFLLALLIGIVIMALPAIRAKFHNQFEKTHRFGGWTALLLFWLQTIFFIADQSSLSLATALLQSPSFWLLSLITFSIALPWLRLKKVAVDMVNPSSHVVLANFDYGVTPFAGSSTAISRNPLVEWHSFANVPTPDKDGFRLTISRAGDWTGQLIDDLPSHLWVKGIPTAGVGNIDQLFKRVIWVATGSGIGPCIPHLLSQNTPSLLIWATRSPRKTYGDALVDEILAVQPNAIIWNTDTHGKPDMVKLAYKAYQDFNAEAVICISNKKLTWKVVYGMESRNIPAYGAIWDS